MNGHWESNSRPPLIDRFGRRPGRYAVPVAPFGPTSPARRPTFGVTRLEQEFADQGWAVVPLFSDHALAAIRRLYEQVGPAPDDPRVGFFPGNASCSAEWKHAVLQGLLPIVDECAQRVLAAHHVFHTTFITKWPGPDGVVDPHQDPTMVDAEPVSPGVTFWSPLHPVGYGEADPGMIRMRSGSHRSGVGEWYRAHCAAFPSGLGQPDEVGEHVDAESPQLRPGEAVALDHRLVHWSPPNVTDSPRVVVAVAARHREAGTVRLEVVGGASVEVYAVDDRYFAEPDRHRGTLIRRVAAMPYPAAPAP